jgi:drug/metabolite transporter (DMT)-like permease
MVFLLLSFLMSVGIFAFFNLFPRFKVDTFQAIVFNYIVCVITGLLFIGSIEPVMIREYRPWMIIALFLGGVFIGTFYLIAITTQRYGISVSSIASKMSLAIPVVFALFVFDIESKNFNAWNYLGLFSALMAIYLSSSKSTNQAPTAKRRGFSWILLPILVFIFGGIIDTSINYANYRYITPSEESVFPIYIFAMASLIGIVVLITRNRRIKYRNIVWGTILGVINYFSVYFLLRALSAFQNDGALLYPILNMLIILGSAGVSVLFFDERLKKKNKIGLALSLISIFLISHQEIIAYLQR